MNDLVSESPSELVGNVPREAAEFDEVEALKGLIEVCGEQMNLRASPRAKRYWQKRIDEFRREIFAICEQRAKE